MSAPRRSLAAALAVATGLALVAVTVDLFLGAARLAPRDVLAALVGGDVAPWVRDVVWLDRVPRVALGLAVGAALAVAGTLFQALVRNPLADPYVIGVGPGALLGAAGAGALGFSGRSVGGLSAAAVGAFAGAVLAAALVLGVAGRRGRDAGARLLLAGVAVGAFVTAVATWALYVENESWQDAVRWLLGSLAFADAPRIALAAVATGALTLLAWARARDLDALALGDEAARLCGVDTTRTVRGLAAAGCVLVAAAVAAAGLVGFVGLVVPHVARRLAGPRHRRLLPVAALLGGGLLVAADAIARSAKAEVPVGVVTALLGAPVFAVLVRRSARAGA
ncbi:MAG: iron ABC transporter permease [Planctomycetes bacterium]|nr:iron ABC transporter permease [Planctomycetota bacterium]